jgi:hypothetical protein
VPRASCFCCCCCRSCKQATVYFCDSSDLSFTQNPNPEAQCRYRISYAEQSSSEGRLVQDVFTFPSSSTSVPVTFGCEASETGEIYKQKPDGILGMGNSPGAFHSQVGSLRVLLVSAICFLLSYTHNSTHFKFRVVTVMF